MCVGQGDVKIVQGSCGTERKRERGKEKGKDNWIHQESEERKWGNNRDGNKEKHIFIVFTH